ncbi:MAG: serine/threonine-protein phosphatase [Eubacteriales bacterium]|nr:serine/threonine-protein phosphatase [Eubacteriales bacterium]
MINYLAAHYTDKGSVKKVNQDAMLLMEAETEKGPLLFAVVADGMGGLSYGEKASARMVQSFREWFAEKLPVILREEKDLEQQIKLSVQIVLKKVNEDLNLYGKMSGAACGTTVVTLMLFNGRWICTSVGDSRLYQLRNGVMQQITKDHTFIQREMDRGRMTREEAESSNMRNTLLQCIGAGGTFVPDYFTGDVNAQDVFFLCSDGMRHKMTNEEFTECFRPDLLKNEDIMRQKLEECTNRSLDMGEQDNISGILVLAKEL